MSAVQPPYQQPPYGQQQQYAPPQRKSNSANVIGGCFLGLALALVLGGGATIAYFIYRANSSTVSSSDDESGYAPSILPPVTRELINESRQVQDNSVDGWEFHLSESARVDISARVESGGEFSLWVMDSNEYDDFVSANRRLLGGNFMHFPNFHAERVRIHEVSGQLAAGSYRLLLKEASDANLLRRPDTSLVHVRLALTH